MLRSRRTQTNEPARLVLTPLHCCASCRITTGAARVGGPQETVPCSSDHYGYDYNGHRIGGDTSCSTARSMETSRCTPVTSSRLRAASISSRST